MLVVTPLGVVICPENFTIKATEETEETQALLEVDFEFVCQKDELMFFRKRK